MLWTAVKAVERPNASRKSFVGANSCTPLPPRHSSQITILNLSDIIERKNCDVPSQIIIIW